MPFTQLFLCIALLASSAMASQSYIIKMKSHNSQDLAAFTESQGGTLSLISEAGFLYEWTVKLAVDVDRFEAPGVEYLERNRTISLFRNPSLEQIPESVKQRYIDSQSGEAYFSRADNPEFKTPQSQGLGADPMIPQCWGLDKVGAIQAFQNQGQGDGIIVAVTDTGVDYNHQDLINNMWRNPGEIAGDEIDNDGNGYVDDIVGWDFAKDDNKPFDLTVSILELLTGGGNPGHGTHVSGVIAAQYNNTLGISGVAPKAKIMALRFLTEKGQGTTAHSIKAIDYAVANGANIINASWGSEQSEEPDQSLIETIQRAEKAGVIFVAAAGNGRQGTGYDIDNDPKPTEPAIYNLANMVTVAATDVEDKIAAFSNFGNKSVKVGAPGVKVLSTVPDNKYQDTVVNLGLMKVTWDGTSMAAPFVSGALAVIWSSDRSLDYAEVRDRLLSNTQAIDDLDGKVETGGYIRLK